MIRYSTGYIAIKWRFREKTEKRALAQIHNGPVSKKNPWLLHVLIKKLGGIQKTDLIIIYEISLFIISFWQNFFGREVYFLRMK